MKKPKRRLLKQIFATGNRACHFPVVGVDDEEDWAENYRDENDGEEPDYDMDSQPTFAFAYVKSLLPEGVDLENCFCSVYFDEDYLKIKVYQDLGANPEFKSAMKEHAELDMKEKLEHTIRNYEESMKYAERQVNEAKAELERLNAKAK